MRVWITRASPGAEVTASRLTALGHAPLVAPLLSVRPIAGAKLDFNHVGLIAFTSANAVKAFAAKYPQGGRSLPVFAVGEATAEAARAAGFAETTSADGDVAALAALIIQRKAGIAGAVLHPSALKPAGDLAGALSAAGVEVRSTPIYDTVEPSALPQRAVEALAADAVDAVLLHSPRAAAVLARLLPGSAQDMVACALSEACAAPIREIDFARVLVAPEPTETALLALLT